MKETNKNSKRKTNTITTNSNHEGNKQKLQNKQQQQQQKEKEGHKQINKQGEKKRDPPPPPLNDTPNQTNTLSPHSSACSSLQFDNPLSLVSQACRGADVFGKAEQCYRSAVTTACAAFCHKPYPHSQFTSLLTRQYNVQAVLYRGEARCTAEATATADTGCLHYLQNSFYKEFICFFCPCKTHCLQ